MHILILASSTDSAEAMQVVLGDTTDRCTVVIDWTDVVASLEKDHPNLIVVERAALVQVELATLLKLTEPGSWPYRPTRAVDTTTYPAVAGSWNGVGQAQSYAIDQLRCTLSRPSSAS